MGKESGLDRKAAPETDLSIDLHASELFLHYLHLSNSKEAEDDSFMMHYNNFEKVELGLRSGFIDYSDARQLLLELINCHDTQNVFTIYFSWFEILDNYKDHTEVEGDAEKLKQATDRALRLLEDPATQAEYFGFYASVAQNFLTSAQINGLLAEQVESVEKFLLQKSEITSGDTGSLMAFLSSCRNCGYFETETITEYLIQLAKKADPKRIESFTVFRLIQFLSDEALVSPWIREDFLEKVAASLPDMEHGVLNKEIIIEGLISIYLKLGKVEEAYDLLGQIKESTSYLHAVGSFMKDGSRNLARIDHLFYTRFLSLVADRIGSKIEDLSEEFIKSQRRMWVFHKFLRAKHLAKYEKEFTLFRDEEILFALKAGTMPTAKLSNIAELVDPNNPESLFLMEPVLSRSRRLFLFNDAETETMMDAIGAVIILKNKGVYK